MAVSQAWKGHERYVAKALQGHRIPRGANFSDSLPDVVANASHSLARAEGVIYAECKHSQNSPWVRYISDIYDGKLLSITGRGQKFIFFELSDIHLLSDSTRHNRAIPLEKTVPKYLLDNLEQCRGYTPDTLQDMDMIMAASLMQWTGSKEILKALPIVVMAQKHKSFRLAYTSSTDLLKYYQLQNDKSYWQV